MKIFCSSPLKKAALVGLFTTAAVTCLSAQESQEIFDRMNAQDEVIAKAKAELDEAESVLATAEGVLEQCRNDNPPNSQCDRLIAQRAAAREAVMQAAADAEAAQTNFQRAEDLFRQELISQSELAAAQNDFAAAENDLKAREADLAAIESQLEQCEEEENSACDDAVALVAVFEEDRQEAEDRRDAAIAVKQELAVELEQSVLEENRPGPVQTNVSGTTPQVTFPMREWFVYQSQVSSDLKDWRDVFNPVEGEADEMFVSETDLAKIDFTYYRVSMQLSARGREMLAAGNLP